MLKSENSLETENFASLFKQYYPRIYAYTLSYIEDRDTTERLVLKTFMAFWKQKAFLQDEKNILRFLLHDIHCRCLQRVELMLPKSQKNSVTNKLKLRKEEIKSMVENIEMSEDCI